MINKKNCLKVTGLVAAMFMLAACETSQEGDTEVVAEVEAAPETSVAPVRTGPEPGTQEDLVLNVGDRVFFDLDKYDLKRKARRTLENQAAWLNKYPRTKIVIEGHCDERGTREYNLALGERRANAVKNYLVALGVNESRISTLSYGKERPVALGSNESAWAQNRRSVTLAQ